MKTIYTAVMERLKEKVKELKWIDLDEGQLEYYDERPSVGFPCVLVDIAPGKCEDIYSGVQLCEASVIVRIAQNIPVRRTNSVASGSVRGTALERYDLIDKVYKVLQGFGTEEFNPLSRTKQYKETRGDGLFVYRIEFGTEFKDLTAEE